MANIPFLTQGYFTTRVGIGTDSPDAQLQVVETTAANIATFENTTQTQSVVNIKTAEVLNNASALTFSVGDNLSSTDIFAEIRGKVVNDGGALKGDLIFITNKGDDGEERMRIDSDGNVGIGTEDPPQKLTVNGGAFITSNLISPGNIGTYTYNAAAIDYQNNGTRFWSWGNATTRGSFSFIQLESDGQNQQTALTINSDGNVGIGADSPLTAGGDAKWLTMAGESTSTYSGGIIYTIGAERNAFTYFESDYLIQQAQAGFGQKFKVNNSSLAMTILSSGKVGIGETNPTESLEVSGNSITRSKTRGLGTNYATSEGWVAGAASTFTSRDGFFGGDFVNNGPSAENKVEFDDGPFGSRELVWMTVPEVGENADGGWNKTMDGFNNATNNGFMSVVYVRRDSGTASGFFFHGCANSVTNNLDGTANLNPYFSNGLAVSNLPADVWCVAIGIIYASSDANTTPSTLGGIYRLDTGVKFSNSITFRQKSGQTIQQQRVYHSNSTSTTAQLDFAKPGFYVLDGSEPTLSELTAGAAGGDDVFWSANGNDIYNDNTGNVGIGTTTPQAPLNIHSISSVASGQYNSPSALMLSNGNGTAGVGGTILFGADLDSASAASNTQASIYSSNFASSTAGGYGNLNFATKDTLAATVLTPRMTIQYTGNVGIGTIDPDAKLHVAGGDIRLQKIGIAGDSTFGFYAGNNASTLSDVNYANINTGVTTGNTNSESGFMSFETRNSGTVAERMRIDPTGNVGIGTNNPLARLDVKAPSSDIAGQIIVGGLIDTGTDDVAFGVLNFANINAANTQLNDILASISGEKTDSSNRGELVFSTSNDAAPAERMRIDKDGNVGIGTDSPTEKFVVNGSVNSINQSVNFSTGPYRAVMDIISASKLVRIGSVKGAVTPAGDEGEVAFFVNSLEKVRIDKDGNVGIDNTLPIGKLMVGSNWDAVETNNLFIKESTPISSFDPRVVNTANLGITYATTSNTTTGPDKVGLTLHNNAGVAGQFSPMLIFSSKESGASPFKSAMAGIYARSPLATGASGAWNDGELIFATAGTNSAGIVQRMVINKEGKVGIGTDSPTQNLQIEGETSMILLKSTTANQNASIQFNTKVGTTQALKWELGTNINNSLDFEVFDKVANVNRFLIEGATGNIGIGSETPGEKLDVAGGNIRLVDASAGLIFTAPNGKLWKQTISNTGVPVYTDVSP